MTTAKAWVGYVGALSTALATALADDVFDLNDASQVIIAVVTASATLYAVYRVPNQERKS